MKARTLVAAAGAALVLGAMPAPAQATVEAKHCLHPPYTVDKVLYCGCVAVATIGQVVLPGSQWACPAP